jgi:hypothetical protein
MAGLHAIKLPVESRVGIHNVKRLIPAQYPEWYFHTET